MTPAVTGTPQLDEMAYAIYHFAFEGQVPEPVCRLEWETAPTADEIWIGCSDWDKDRWVWHAADDTDSVALPQVNSYLDGDGQMLVIVALIGNGTYELGSVSLSVYGPGDWCMGRHDAQNTGRSNIVGPQAPVVAWEYETGRIAVSAPVFGKDGTAYLERESLEASDITPGEDVVFAFSPDGEVIRSRMFDYEMGGKCGAIGPEGNIYFVGGYRGKTLYVNTPELVELWRINNSLVGAWHPIIGDDGTVYISYYTLDHVNDRIVAMNPDGTEKWSYDTYDNGPIALGTDGCVYFGTDPVSHREMHALNPDGTHKWSVDCYVSGGQIPAIGPDGTIYVSSWDGLYALNPENGDEKWHFDTHEHNSIPIVVALAEDGTIYFRGKDSVFYALNPDMSIKWSNSDYLFSSTPPVVGGDGTIYASGGPGIIAFDPAGTVKWVAEISASGMSIGDNGYLYLARNSKLAAIGGDFPVYVDSVYPTTGMTGRQFTANVGCAGGEDNTSTYLWNFGGGATPNTSTDKSFTITLGSPGSYNASVTVDNAHGEPDVHEFELTVHSGNQQGAWWRANADQGNTNRSQYTGPQTNHKLWDYSFLANETGPHSPVIDADGTVYTCSTHVMRAIDPAGTELWSYDFADLGLMNPVINEDGLILSIAQGSPDRLIAINPDGTKAWQRYINHTLTAPLLLTPTGDILTGCRGLLLSYDFEGYLNWSRIFTDMSISLPFALSADGSILADIGTKLWSISADGQTTNWSYTTTIYGYPAVRDDGIVIIGARSALEAVDAGTREWYYSHNSKPTYSTAISPDGRVYMGSEDLVVLDPDGAVLWWKNIEYPRLALGGDGTIYAACETGIYAYASDGTDKWSYNEDGVEFYFPVIDSNGTLYVSAEVPDSHVKLYAFKDE